MPGDTRPHLARIAKSKRAAPKDLDAVLAKQWRAVEVAEAVLLDAAAGDDAALALRGVHALTQAAGAYAKLLEVGEIEARLAEVEASIEAQAATPPGGPSALRRIS